MLWFTPNRPPTATLSDSPNKSWPQTVGLVCRSLKSGKLSRVYNEPVDLTFIYPKISPYSFCRWGNSASAPMFSQISKADDWNFLEQTDKCSTKCKTRVEKIVPTEEQDWRKFSNLWFTWDHFTNVKTLYKEKHQVRCSRVYKCLTVDSDKFFVIL